MANENRTIAPTNRLGERHRGTDIATVSQSQTHSEVGWTIGVITHVDAKTKMVQVSDPVTKLPVCSNMRITLAHSARALNDMCGQVRAGMMVLVIHKGIHSTSPTAAAFIIGDERESVAAFKQENDAAVGFGQSLIGE